MNKATYDKMTSLIAQTCLMFVYLTVYAIYCWVMYKTLTHQYSTTDTHPMDGTGLLLIMGTVFGGLGVVILTSYTIYDDLRRWGRTLADFVWMYGHTDEE